MSLKAIDLQMAIHRNDEAGLRQNQLLHKPEVDQSQLADQSVKQADRERGQTAKLAETEEAHIQSGGKDGSGQQQHRGHKQPPVKESGTTLDSRTPPHPFKGHFFDVSL